MLSRIGRTALAIAAAGLFAAPATAQVWKGPARIEGVVKDDQGNPVAGAKVELRMKGQPSGPSTKTDKKGRWAVMGLAGGAWDLDVTADGFAPRQLGGIQLSEIASNRLPPVEVQLLTARKAVPQDATEVKVGVPKEAVDAVKAGDDLMMQGRFAEAVAEYEKAQPALPDHVPLMMQMARAYHGAKDETKSQDMLKRVLAKEPDNVAALLLLGNAALEKGDLDAGKAYLEKVPPSAITDPTAYTNIGILYMNKNKPQDAETYFTKAIELDATYAEGYYYRGLARYQAKKAQDAKADFQKFLAAKPDAPEAKEVRDLLSSIK